MDLSCHFLADFGSELPDLSVVQFILLLVVLNVAVRPVKVIHMQVSFSTSPRITGFRRYRTLSQRDVSSIARDAEISSLPFDHPGVIPALSYSYVAPFVSSFIQSSTIADLLFQVYCTLFCVIRQRSFLRWSSWIFSWIGRGVG